LCREPRAVAFYRGVEQARCGKCDTDYRSGVEKRRDAVLEKYGADPAAYTPAVLKELAADGLFDGATAFCPAGRLTLAETLARERAGLTTETR
jgi:hypothetical protein